MNENEVSSVYKMLKANTKLINLSTYNIVNLKNIFFNLKNHANIEDLVSLS